MGLFDMLMGNASDVDLEKIQEKFSFVLVEGEAFLKGFKLVRDMFIFTNKRILLIDPQGVTGKKKEMLTIPFKNIEMFSAESMGTFDTDAELKIWVKGMGEPICKKFGKTEQLEEVYQILSEAVL